jgi:Xaa-Pro aminopeptidase
MLLANLESRIKKVQERLNKENLDGFLVTRFENKRYLTNFSGSTSWVIVTQSKCLILVDGRYTVQAEEESPSLIERVQISDYLDGFPKELPSVLHQLKIKRLGIEAHQMTLLESRRIEEEAGGIILVSTTGWIEGLRIKKTEDEIQKLKAAISTAEEAYQKGIEAVQSGVEEIMIAHEILSFLSRKGLKTAFDTIAASGERSAMPHGRPTNRKIQMGDIVVIDMGAVWEGYYSDITRTVCLGKPSDEAKNIFALLQKAQEAAYKAIRPGVIAKDVDWAARKVIQDAGFGDYFSHGLGHGIGLEVHEAPSIRKTGDQVLEAGMVITVEPGVYIPGKFGMRLEDDVLVTESGCQVLTSLPHILEI